MPRIHQHRIAFDDEDLDWFIACYGDTPWAVYIDRMDEVVTHDEQSAGDDPAGDPFTEQTAREYLAEMDRRFGPGSPMDLGSPLYAVALHYGLPAFRSRDGQDAIKGGEPMADTVHGHSFDCAPPRNVFNPADCDCGFTYAEEERAQADLDAMIPWAVYVLGPNVLLVAQGQDIGGFEPCGPPFTEDTARSHAAGINAVTARVNAEDPSPFSPVVHAVVLHHGAPVAETAGA